MHIFDLLKLAIFLNSMHEVFLMEYSYLQYTFYTLLYTKLSPIHRFYAVPVHF